MNWDPAFLDRSPMMEPLREPARALRSHDAWPGRDALQALIDARGIANAAGRPLRLIASADGVYEERIRTSGEMPFREGDWHDLFNVLAWLAYPRAKAALNDLHTHALVEERRRAAPRGARRDALTLFDEGGVIVLSSDASLIDDLRAMRWRRLFVERREEARAAMRFCVIGHALFEKALRPYVGMTAHAMLIPLGPEARLDLPGEISSLAPFLDSCAADAVRALTGPRDLSPLPVLGVPGWWPGNECTAFYDNAAYFRTSRRSTKI